MMRNQLEPIEITVEEGTALEKNVASNLSTISETTKNELPIQLVAPKQKAFPLVFLVFFLTLFQCKN